MVHPTNQSLPSLTLKANPEQIRRFLQNSQFTYRASARSRINSRWEAWTQDDILVGLEERCSRVFLLEEGEADDLLPTVHNYFDARDKLRGMASKEDWRPVMGASVGLLATLASGLAPGLLAGIVTYAVATPFRNSHIEWEQQDILKRYAPVGGPRFHAGPAALAKAIGYPPSVGHMVHDALEEIRSREQGE